jgi:hypothetical protein
LATGHHRFFLNINKESFTNHFLVLQNISYTYIHIYIYTYIHI